MAPIGRISMEIVPTAVSVYEKGLVDGGNGDIDWGSDGNGFNIALLIILSSSLGTFVIALLVIGVYFICLYAGGPDNLDTGSPLFLASNFHILSNGQPSFIDEETLRDEEERLLPLLPQYDQQLYGKAKSFEELYPPNLTKMGKQITPLQQQLIDDRGLHAFLFEHDQTASHDDRAFLNPNFTVEDKTDITFLTSNPSCALLNLPLPIKNRERDTIYFEVKLFELPGYNSAKATAAAVSEASATSQEPSGDAADTDVNIGEEVVDKSLLQESTEPVFDIGLTTKPYPPFRLPGFNKYSVSYENNGKVRICRPFDNAPTILPKLAEGDVVGVGFRPATGSVFFTRNGKKLYDIIHGMKLNLYPAIGAYNCANYKFQVNLGQLGFVFIEANVKKWGLAKSFGTLGAPPAYGLDNEEDYTLIARGDPIPPSYPSQEDFFGAVNKSGNADENTPLLVSLQQDYQGTGKLSTIPISNPPSYPSSPEEASQSSSATNKEAKFVLGKQDDSESVQHETPDSHIDLQQRLYELRSTAHGFEDTSDSEIPQFHKSASANDVHRHTEGTSAQLFNNIDSMPPDFKKTSEIGKLPKLSNGTMGKILKDTSPPQNNPSTTPTTPLSPTSSKRRYQKKSKNKKKKKGKLRGITF